MLRPYVESVAAIYRVSLLLTYKDGCSHIKGKSVDAIYRVSLLMKPYVESVAAIYRVSLSMTASL